MAASWQFGGDNYLAANGRWQRFTMCALSGRWANRARAGNGGLQAKSRIHTVGHLRPFMPQKTRVGNDRSQSTTDVARRRNRNEKLYKAGARSSVTLAAQNADRRAAVSEIELALSTHIRHLRFSEAAVQRPARRRRVSAVRCNRLFAGNPCSLDLF